MTYEEERDDLLSWRSDETKARLAKAPGWVKNHVAELESHIVKLNRDLTTKKEELEALAGMPSRIRFECSVEEQKKFIPTGSEVHFELGPRTWATIRFVRDRGDIVTDKLIFYGSHPFAIKPGASNVFEVEVVT